MFIIATSLTLNKVCNQTVVFKRDIEEYRYKVRIRGKALTSAEVEPSVRLETLSIDTASLRASVYWRTCVVLNNRRVIASAVRFRDFACEVHEVSEICDLSRNPPLHPSPRSGRDRGESDGERASRLRESDPLIAINVGLFSPYSLRS